MIDLARCPVAECRALMRFVMDRLGRIRPVCDACERRMRGLCLTPGCVRRATLEERCTVCVQRLATDRALVEQRARELTAEQAIERRRKRQREWSRQHPEKRRAAAQRYREKHGAPDREKARGYLRTYYARHRDEILAKKRADRAAAHGYYRTYYEQHRGRILANQKARRQATATANG